MVDFPCDDDGQVLRSLQDKGVDLSLPREIEFYCYAENKVLADDIARKLSEMGYKVDIFFDDEAPSEDKVYSVYMSLNMIPSYDDIVEAQNNINVILHSFNTRCDGWGTLTE